MKRLIVMLFPLLFLTACFALPIEEAFPPPPIFTLEEPPPWRIIPAARGDVHLFSTIPFIRRPASVENLSFSIEGLLITGLYVTLGESVSPGDLIASLDRSDIAEELEAVAREESRLSLLLTQIIRQHEHILWVAEVSGFPVDDEFYIHQRRDLAQDLENIRLEIDYLNRQYEARFLRAGIYGTITRTMTLVEGEVSAENMNIAIITDQTYDIYVVRGSYVDLLQSGERFRLVDDEVYAWMVVATPEELGLPTPENPEAILLPEDPNFIPRHSGRIHIEFDAAYNVIYIPTNVLRRAGERTFVFVLEDGIRRTRDVEIGLVGTHFIEIVSGLAVGEELVI